MGFLTTRGTDLLPFTNIANSFRDSFATELQTQSRSDPQLLPFLEQMEKIDCTARQTAPSWPEPQTVSDYLTPALKNLDCTPVLAEAVRSLAGAVSWYQILEGEGIEPYLAKGLIAGQMAGQVGLVPADAIRTGLFLLAPGIHYPLHQHDAPGAVFRGFRGPYAAAPHHGNTIRCPCRKLVGDTV